MKHVISVTGLSVGLIAGMLASTLNGFAQDWGDSVQPGPTGGNYYVILHTPTQAGGTTVINGGPLEINNQARTHAVRVGTEVININEFERAGSDDDEIAELKDRVAKLEQELRMAVAQLASMDVQPPENSRTFRIGIGIGAYAGNTNVSVTLSRRGNNSDFSVATTGEGSNQIIRTSMGVSFSNGRNLSRDIEKVLANSPTWYLNFPGQTLVDEWLASILSSAVTNVPSDLK